MVSILRGYTNSGGQFANGLTPTTMAVDRVPGTDNPYRNKESRLRTWGDPPNSHLDNEQGEKNNIINQEGSESTPRGGIV